MLNSITVLLSCVLIEFCLLFKKKKPLKFVISLDDIKLKHTAHIWKYHI